MKRTCAVAPLALLLIAALSNVISRPVSAADDKGYAGFERWVMEYGVSKSGAADAGFLKAKHEFEDALQKHDKMAVSSLLNDNFQWVSSDGEQHSKALVLEDLEPLAKNNEGALDVRTTDFTGDVERLIGLHRNERFVHLWAKNHGVWQAFVFLDIPLPKERKLDVDPPAPPKDPGAPCINPCQTVGEFKPADASQAEVLRVWLTLKNSEWHPNAEVWASHSDVYHETIAAARRRTGQCAKTLRRKWRQFGRTGDADEDVHLQQCRHPAESAGAGDQTGNVGHAALRQPRRREASRVEDCLKRANTHPEEYGRQERSRLLTQTNANLIDGNPESPSEAPPVLSPEARPWRFSPGGSLPPKIRAISRCYRHQSGER
jgi:hypothetical protein